MPVWCDSFLIQSIGFVTTLEALMHRPLADRRWSSITGERVLAE
jgi:hypothetical protein